MITINFDRSPCRDTTPNPIQRKHQLNNNNIFVLVELYFLEDSDEHWTQDILHAIFHQGLT